MFLENKQLDKSVPIPLYFQLKEAILEEIKSEKYEADSLIPTEKEFSEQFDISRTTVRQAITELVQEGYLYRVKSKGTFICQPKISQDFMQKIETFNIQMVRAGMKPSTEVLNFEVTKAMKQVAENLAILEGDDVIYLNRKRFADGKAIVTAETYLSYADCGFIMSHDFECESLYKILSEQKETRICSVKRIVEAVEATTSDSRELDIKKGKPIQLFHSVAMNEYGKPVEYSIARYRGDRSRFEVTIFGDTTSK